jgi:hypothetical protein
MAARHGRVARLPAGRSDAVSPKGPAGKPPAALIPGREHASREELLGLATTMPGTSSRQQQWRRADAFNFAVDWLEGFPGDSWQDRWLLSGSGGLGRKWGPRG